MKTEEETCPNCGVTDHAMMEAVPATIFLPEEDASLRADVSVCDSCGRAEIIPPEDEEIEEVMDEYIDFLEENEILTEEEAEEYR